MNYDVKNMTENNNQVFLSHCKLLVFPATQSYTCYHQPQNEDHHWNILKHGKITT